MQNNFSKLSANHNSCWKTETITVPVKHILDIFSGSIAADGVHGSSVEYIVILKSMYWQDKQNI